MQRIKCKDHPISLKAKLREFSSSKRKVIAKSKKVSDFCPPLPVPRRGTELRFPFAPSFTPYLKGVLSFAFPVTFGDNIGGDRLWKPKVRKYEQEEVKGKQSLFFENLWGKGNRVPFTPSFTCSTPEGGKEGGKVGGTYGHRRKQRIAKLKKPKKPLGILNMFLPSPQTEGKSALPLSSELKSQENSFAFGDGIRPNDLTKLNTTEKRTPKVPFLGDHLLAHLDNNGVAKVGTWVSPGDILVGKVRPLANKLKSSRASTQLAWEIISSKKKEFNKMEG